MDFESSEESNSSDNEFWQSLDKSNPSIRPTLTIHQPDPPASSQLLVSEKERLIKTILNIRDSKQVELQTQEIKLINSSKKELVKKINEIKNEFFKEYSKLKTDYADSVSVVIEKDQKISELSNTVITQENLITSLRISLSSKNITKHKPENNALNREILTLKHQIYFYKETIEDFKKEVNNYKAVIKGLNEEIMKLKSVKGYGELDNEQDGELVEKLKCEKEELKKEFERYKFEAEKEVELREMINNRYLNSITVLQEELRVSNGAVEVPKPNIKSPVDKRSPVREEVQTRIKLERPQAKSLPRYNYKTRDKIASNYSFKEYKAFNQETPHNINTPSRSTPKPRLEILPPRNILLPSNTDNRQRFFKGSVLFLNKN